MNKQQFIADPSVQLFIDWFISITDDEFNHRYCVIPKGNAPVAESWNCTSIYNAFQQYYWPFSYKNLIGNKGETVSGTTFTDSESALHKIKNHLETSISNSNNQEILNACKMVLDWGGVLSRGRKGKTNEDKLIDINTRFGLFNYLREAKNLLNPETASTTDGFEIHDQQNNGSILIMNSGFTKIYSILIKDFIIYDGRVGAGLGLLLSQFKQQSPHTNVDVLMFAYGNAAKSDKCLNTNMRRNPSVANLSFSNLFQGQTQEIKSIKHIQNNLKASWLIDEIKKKLPADSGFLGEKNPTRALEAALFMIGNCVNIDCQRNQA